MNPLFRIDFSISDSLKIVRKSVLIYETIILPAGAAGRTAECDRGRAVTWLPRGGGAALYPRGNRGTDPQGTDFFGRTAGTPPGPHAEVSAAVWGQRGAWPCRDRSCLGRGAGRDRGRNDAADYKRDLRHRIWGLHLVLDAGNIAALL